MVKIENIYKNYNEQNKYGTKFISNLMPEFEQSHRGFTTKMLIRPAGYLRGVGARGRGKQVIGLIIKHGHRSLQAASSHFRNHK